MKLSLLSSRIDSQSIINLIKKNLQTHKTHSQLQNIRYKNYILLLFMSQVSFVQ